MEVNKEFYKNADKLLENLFSGLSISGEEFDKIKLATPLTSNIDERLELKFNKLKIVTMTINAVLPMILNY